MSALPWIKLYTEMLDDPRVGRLPDPVKWRFIQLLLIAGECASQGYLIDGDRPLTDADLAWRLRIPLEELTPDLDQLTRAGLLSHQGDAWLVANFAKRQNRYAGDKRAVWRAQKQRQRTESSDKPDVDNQNMSARTNEMSVVDP